MFFPASCCLVKWQFTHIWVCLKIRFPFPLNKKSHQRASPPKKNKADEPPIFVLGLDVNRLCWGFSSREILGLWAQVGPNGLRLNGPSAPKQLPRVVSTAQVARSGHSLGKRQQVFWASAGPILPGWLVENTRRTSEFWGKNKSLGTKGTPRRDSLRMGWFENRGQGKAKLCQAQLPGSSEGEPSTGRGPVRLCQ